MTSSFNALLINKNDNKVSASIKQISLADLPDEEVLVDVAYSTINYKDGLATTGTLPICRKFPMVGGIDLAGTVIDSKSRMAGACTRGL